MTQAAKKQRQVIGRMVNGELHVIAEIVPFVSSRPGPDVSHETEQEHESEWHRVSAAGRAEP
jgi:hypothetical protein